MGLKIPDKLVYQIRFSDIGEKEEYEDLEVLWNLAAHGAISAYWDVIADDWWWE